MSKSSGLRDSRQRWTKAQFLDRLDALERRIAASGDGGALPAEAIDAIPAGFVAFDSEDRLVVCNKAYRALFGYSDADAAPGVSFDALMRLDIERQTVAAGDRAGDGYPRRRLADWRRAGVVSEDIHFGDGRWIQVRDRKTASGGRVSIHADITVLKRAEGALRLSQEQLRNLVETAPDAIISVNEAGLVLTWNARAAEMFGYGAKAAIGKSLTKLMPKRYRGAHAKGLARVNSGAEPRLIGNTVELVGLRKSGEEFPIELSLSSALHEGTRLHTGMVRDVSELRRTETALRESERRYETITANVPGVVYERVLHPDGSVEIPCVSPGLLETHGLDPEAVMRDPTPWLAAIHPGDRERLAASNARSVERLEDWSLEYRIIARDGTTKWVRGISHIRREDNGDVVWDGILLDISEERRNRQRIAEVAKFPSEDPNPVLRVAPDGAVLYANDAARTVDGLLVGRRKDRLSRKLAAAREQALAGGGRRIAEFAGGERIFSFTVAPVVGETYANLYGRDITDDRLTQRRVADIAKFAAENPNPMFRVEPDGKVLYANDATRDVDGLLVGRRKDRLSRKLAKVLAAVSRDGRRRNVEFAGTERVFSLAVTPVAGETYINLYGRDITREYHARNEMAAAREAAVAAEALLRDAIDNISDGFVVYDADERLVTCNRKWKDFYGYSDAEAAPGVTYRDLVRLDIARGAISKDVGYRDTYQDMRLAYRKVKEGSFEVKLADGRWLLIHERSTSAGGRVGIHTDITELKRAEEALRESAERYDLAVTGANDGLWDWNLVAGEIYISPHAKKLLGLEFEGETTAPDEWNARVHPDDLEQFKDRERMYLSGEIEHYTNEYRVLGAGGAMSLSLLKFVGQASLVDDAMLPS